MKKSESVNARLAEQVGKSSLFCSLPLDIVERHILPFGQTITFSKQEYIFTPSELADRLGIIISGTVHILNLFSDGNYSLMNALSAPKVVGADLISTKSRQPPYYAVCATPTTVAFFPSTLFLEQGDLPEACRIEILNRLLTIVSQENMQKYYRIAILSQKGLRERVLTYLSMQAQRRNANTFEIPFTREELAAFLCVNRSALSHELSLMKQGGLIDFHKNVFKLLSKG
jgi:CRP-like cAMP-binding protein